MNGKKYDVYVILELLNKNIDKKNYQLLVFKNKKILDKEKYIKEMSDKFTKRYGNKIKVIHFSFDRLEVRVA